MAAHYLEPGTQTQGSIEIAAERDGVCISTLRRAKFDLGICSHKDCKPGLVVDTLALGGLAAGQARWPIYLAVLAPFPETKYLRTMPTHREGHSKVTKPQKMHYGLHYLQYWNAICTMLVVDPSVYTWRLR